MGSSGHKTLDVPWLGSVLGPSVTLGAMLSYSVTEGMPSLQTLWRSVRQLSHWDLPENLHSISPSQMSLVPLSLLSLSIRAAALVLGLLKTSSLLGPNLKLAAF